MEKNQFIVAKKHAAITTGETIRMLREFKGWTQVELSEKSGINSKNISMLENDKVDIGKKRTERLAKAFGIHPAIIMFPEYESDLMQQVA